MPRLNWLKGLRISLLLAFGGLLLACSDYQQARSAYAAGDYTKAYQLFQGLAESGDTKAQYDLSLMYIQGIGTKQNIEQGLVWLNRAAEKGNIEAMLELGVLYQKIDTLDNAPQLALYWFEKAAMAGSAVGQYNLAHLYMDGGQIAVDLPKAYIWMSISDSTGNPVAGAEVVKLKASLSSQELNDAQEKISTLKKTLP
ncbi:tetratricopeptide repeat protein [Polynucleobacter hallstattensis]|uniref:tetratricopeptide repeat protein n=1 Tax=Polynucleobacter hallstattensis TaxID=1855586 RepID=UPI001C0C206F|nr:tetratricopeptide repeat protein [Polynucleobacter hallstattensis]MBU3560456.1 sel1 repeat family protein [Polynucleobacter hallstattensis]